MRKTELIVSGEVICPKTKASIVAHEHTNVEALLDQQNRTSSTITQSSAMSQVGVGDDMDLSFCVEDGFYESATLYGKTMVNSIQESSSQDVVLPYEFEEGQYVTINDTKESGALGVELKGQTLVNLHKLKNYSVFGVVLDGGINQHFGNDTSYATWRMFDISMLKPNTEYGVFCWVLENTISENFWDGHIHHSADTVFNPSTELRFSAGETGLKFAKLTTISDFTGKTCGIRHLIDINTPSSEYVKFRCVIVEYQDGMENWDIPYFEGMANVNMPTVKTYNGEYDFQVGNYMTSGTLSGGQHWLFFNCKPNTKYEITVKSGNYNRFGVYSYNGELGKTLTSDKTFYNYITANPNTVYSATGVTGNKANLIGVYLSNNNHNTTLDDVVLEVLENGRKLSDKTSILSLPEEVVLRSLPNGVCDTFNTRTGEYVQRIGKCILDGSESQWTHANISPTNVFELPMTNMKRYTGVGQIICNTLPYSYTNLEVWDTYTGVSPLSARGSIVLRNNNTDTIQDLKAWLSQNPTTICYELETPIVTKINLSSTLKSWNTTTHIYSEIPENTLYPILSHLNPSYPVILKPSTKYSIVANSYSNGHTNSPINFNLGGATASTTVGNRVTTITTPSTLSNELLTMSGRGNKLNNVMVIEGDVVGDEPYFEGICDCKSPILSNVGKNLFNGESRVGYYFTDTGIYEPTPTINQCCNTTPIQVSGGTKYSFLLPEGDMKNGRTFLYDSKMNFITSIINADVRYVITTTQNTKYINFHFDNATPELLSKVQLEESSSATSYESYKSNILSCNGDKIELTEDMFEEGGIGGYAEHLGKTYEELKSLFPSSLSGKRLMTVDLVKVKPNTSYNINSSDNFAYLVCSFNANKMANGETDTGYVKSAIFTTSSDTHYVAVIVKRDNDGSISMLDFKNTNFTLSEVDKTIVLRSLPNGVCDTLNVETGEYVQRIGEATFDGSSDETWKMQSDVGGGKTRFIVTNKTDDRKVYSNQRTTGYLLCDKFREISFYDLYIEGKNGVAGWESGKTISFINSMTALSDFISLISQSPIILQYELETPIVKTVDLSGYPFSYANGHVQLSSGSIEQSLTPKVEYVVQTNRAGAIQANQDRLLNHDKRLAMLEDLVLHQLIQLEYNRAKCTFLSQTRQIFEGGIQMYHTKYELLSEFIEKKLYHSLEEVFEMLDVYFMLGDITDGEYDALYEALMPSAEEIFEVEETFDHEDVEV